VKLGTMDQASDVLISAGPPDPSQVSQALGTVQRHTPQFTKPAGQLPSYIPLLAGEPESGVAGREFTGALPPAPSHHWQVDFGTFLHTPQSTKLLEAGDAAEPTVAGPPVPLHHWHVDFGTFLQTPQSTKLLVSAGTEDAEPIAAGPPLPLHHWQVDLGTFLQTPQSTKLNRLRSREVSLCLLTSPKAVPKNSAKDHKNRMAIQL